MSATPWFSAVPTEFAKDVSGEIWQPPPESRTGAPGYAAASAAAAAPIGAPVSTAELSANEVAASNADGAAVSVLKSALPRIHPESAVLSEQPEGVDSRNRTTSNASTTNEVSSRIRTLQTELAEANSERSLLADKLSALEAASDLERNAAYVLRKELKALRKERKLSMHDVLAHLPSSRQPFHQMLLAAQRSSIPVLMADVQHIMEGGHVPDRHARKSAKSTATLPRRRTGNQVVPMLNSNWRDSRSSTMSPTMTSESMVDDSELTTDAIHHRLSEIREDSLPIAERREKVKELLQLLSDRQTGAHRPVTDIWSGFKQWRRRETARLLFTLTHLPFWSHDIKLVAGKHGQHVGVYFTFVKWTLLVNVFATIVMCAFVVIPYALFYGFGSASVSAIGNNATLSHTDGELFTGIFTGGGTLNASAYFIGSYVIPYSVVALSESKGSDFVPTDATDAHLDIWNIPLAYLVCTIGTLALVFAVVLGGVSRAVKNSVIFKGDRTKSGLDLIAFEYDFSLTSIKGLHITRLARCQRLREKLQEEFLVLEYIKCRPKHLRLRRVGTNLFVLLVLSGAFWVIYMVASLFLHREGGLNLIPALVIAVLFSTVPVVFKRVAKLERYRSRLTEIQVTIARVCVLRFAGLYVFLYAIWAQIEGVHCWETFVGQRIYTQFVVGSIGFELLLNFTKDKFSMVAYKKYPNSLYSRLALGGEPPQFQVVERALTLSYDQSLVWVGTYFCPLLPVLGILRAFVMFYSEKRSTMKHTQPGSTVIASKVGLAWLIWGLMLVTLTLVALPLGYVLTRAPPSGPYMSHAWHDRFINTLGATTTACESGDDVVQDCRVCMVSRDTTNTTATICWQGDRFSSINSGGGIQVTLSTFCAACPRGCGPFRTLSTPFEVMNYESRTWPTWTSSMMYILSTSEFTVALAVLFLCIWLVSAAKSSGRLIWGQRQERLRDTEFWDKKWILDNLANKLGSGKQRK